MYRDEKLRGLLKVSSGQGHQMALVLEVSSGAVHVQSNWTGFRRRPLGHAGLEALPAGDTPD